MQFIFAFITVTLLGLLATASSGEGLHHSRPFWVGMLAVSIVLAMVAAEAFLAFTLSYDYMLPAPGWWRHQMRTTAAGAIISVAALVLTMMAIGTDWERRAGRGGRAGGDVGDIDKPAAGLAPASGRVAVPVQNIRVVEGV